MYRTARTLMHTILAAWLFINKGAIMNYTKTVIQRLYSLESVRVNRRYQWHRIEPAGAILRDMERIRTGRTINHCNKY